MPTKLTIGLSKKFATVGTDGRPDYGSIGADIHLEVELDSQTMAHPDLFREVVADHYATARQSLDAAVSELQAEQPARHVVDMPATMRERQAASAPVNGEGARALEDARRQTEPAAAPASGNGHTKQPVDWGRNSGSAGGQYRAGGDRGGKSYGPPKTGGQLIAWARGLEDNGEAKGLSKWIMYQWGKRHGLGDAKVVEWPEQAVRECYEEARARQENGN